MTKRVEAKTYFHMGIAYYDRLKFRREQRTCHLAPDFDLPTKAGLCFDEAGLEGIERTIRYIGPPGYLIADLLSKH